MDKVLYTYSEMARRLDVRRETICDLVKKLSIPAIRHPVNWKAKAVDEEGFRKIREALTVTVAAS